MDSLNTQNLTVIAEVAAKNVCGIFVTFYGTHSDIH